MWRCSCTCTWPLKQALSIWSCELSASHNYLEPNILRLILNELCLSLSSKLKISFSTQKATQAAKKPKSESSQVTENSFAGPSMLQDQGDALLCALSSSNPSFSKAGSTLTAPLSLESSASMYNSACKGEWPQGSQSLTGYPSTCIKQEPFSIQEPTLPMQTSASSLLQHVKVYKTEQTIDFSPVKQEQEGGGGSDVTKQQPTPQSAYLPPAQLPPPQPSPAQKLSLDKYREKHAVELAASGQKRSLEQHSGGADCDVRTDNVSSSSSTYASSFLGQVDHRKHSQSHLNSNSGSIIASPLKIKTPSSLIGQDRRHHSDKKDKGTLKLRMAIPGSGGSSQLDKSGQSSKDELKMKLKVSSSERHSSSDEGMGSNKSKHSSPMVSKEKQHHNLHHHQRHSHPYPLTHSGNGRGESEGLLRAPPGLASTEGTMLGPVGSVSLSSSRKRVHSEASHNHHPSSSFSTSCSKVSKFSKGGAGAAGTKPLFSLFIQCSSLVSSHCCLTFFFLLSLPLLSHSGGLRTSQQFPPPSESPHEVWAEKLSTAL